MTATALAAAIITLLLKIIDLLQSEQVQQKLKELDYERRTNDARKALAENDARHIAALMADQHDRVQALCGRAGR